MPVFSAVIDRSLRELASEDEADEDDEDDAKKNVEESDPVEP